MVAFEISSKCLLLAIFNPSFPNQFAVLVRMEELLMQTLVNVTVLADLLGMTVQVSYYKTS